MVVAGSAQQLDLSVDVFKPTIAYIGSYVPAGEKLERLTSRLESVSFTIQADGGYWSAEITANGSREFVEDWIEYGLGRHIVIRNPGLDEIWAGEVNVVSATMGSLSVERGPLLDVANRVSVVYTRIIDPDYDPPVIGNQTVTTVVDDTVSQELYGILEDVMSAGTVETDTAEQFRDTYLAENKRPQTSERLTIGQPQQPRVTLRCLGYVHRFKKYIYNIPGAIPSTDAVSYNIESVLDVDPNGFLTDYTGITYNGLLVAYYSAYNRTAWDLIQSYVAVGDVNDNRYVFGVYEGQKARYEAPIDDETAYEHRLSQRGQIIETPQHGLVELWDVVPAKWLFLPDLLVHTSPIVARRNDSRYLFIESTTFRTPDTLQINGVKVERLPQLLAKYQ